MIDELIANTAFNVGLSSSFSKGLQGIIECSAHRTYCDEETAKTLTKCRTSFNKEACILDAKSNIESSSKHNLNFQVFCDCLFPSRYYLKSTWF